MRIILMFLLLPMCSYAQEERIIEITSNSQGDNNVFLIVDTPPRFKGGEQKQVKFYEKISKFDIPKRHERGFPVYFQIVVNEDGSISNVEIINDPSQFLVNEVTRIIKLMPLWVPGRINGKAVKLG
ncbi:energy transducer TonB [Cyclobacterium plantarum]|uniref:TonB C-terminal domain-containing protein n=1 Tax=Cyclobacterium plantarum TaxID=2716263 RepID=A0ABX0H1I6_9BACT|nr:hypothetical protein [Cyclobacterium plantarum]NHE55656.1 hypothetical protein [Cyclobacterium plantarum]